MKLNCSCLLTDGNLLQVYGDHLIDLSLYAPSSSLTELIILIWMFPLHLHPQKPEVKVSRVCWSMSQEQESVKETGQKIVYDL